MGGGDRMKKVYKSEQQPKKGQFSILRLQWRSFFALRATFKPSPLTSCAVVAVCDGAGHRLAGYCEEICVGEGIEVDLGSKFLYAEFRPESLLCALSGVTMFHHRLRRLANLSALFLLLLLSLGRRIRGQ